MIPRRNQLVGLGKTLAFILLTYVGGKVRNTENEEKKTKQGLAKQR